MKQNAIGAVAGASLAYLFATIGVTMFASEARLLAHFTHDYLWTSVAMGAVFGAAIVELRKKK